LRPALEQTHSSREKCGLTARPPPNSTRELGLGSGVRPQHAVGSLHGGPVSVESRLGGAVSLGSRCGAWMDIGPIGGGQVHGRRRLPAPVDRGTNGASLGFTRLNPQSLLLRFAIVDTARDADAKRAQVRAEVAAEGVGALGAGVSLDAADGEVHQGQAARRGIALVAVDADVPQPTCLYSAASMWLRSLSAASQSVAWKPSTLPPLAEQV
jgi:hypothetical protein